MLTQRASTNRAVRRHSAPTGWRPLPPLLTQPWSRLELPLSAGEVLDIVVCRLSLVPSPNGSTERDATFSRLCSACWHREQGGVHGPRRQDEERLRRRFRLFW